MRPPADRMEIWKLQNSKQQQHKKQKQKRKPRNYKIKTNTTNTKKERKNERYCKTYQSGVNLWLQVTNPK